MLFGKLSLSALLPVCALAAWYAPAAHGEVTVNIFQSGSNVNAQATGTLNLTGLLFRGGGGGSKDFVDGSIAGVLAGDNNALYDGYSGFTGPASFGSGGQILTDSGVGDRFGIAGDIGELVVSTGYTSNSAINGSAVFANQTLSSLGLTAGTYTYTLPDDTVTVNISTAAVPELSTMLGFGSFVFLGGLALFRQRKQARQAA